MKNKSNIEETFAFHLRIIGEGIPAPVREHRFHPTRRWRFDFAWPAAKLAVECDGGQMLKKNPTACIDTVRRALAYDARSVFER